MMRFTAEEIEYLVNLINPDCPYTAWMIVMSVLKQKTEHAFEDCGRAVFVNWSQRSREPHPNL